MVLLLPTVRCQYGPVMAVHRTLQDQLDSLAKGDVMPVLLVTDVGYVDDMTVDVSLIEPHDVSPNGYTSVPVFTKRFPYPPPGTDLLEAEQLMRRAALEEFGARLRALLSGD